ncbi:hypothetical protein HDU91_003154 [Kappamyces sp. JEL0680]|nr:hypothetical protein HDU91_003154 [Kappamyces sp. JEL0680]
MYGNLPQPKPTTVAEKKERVNHLKKIYVLNDVPDASGDPIPVPKTPLDYLPDKIQEALAGLGILPSSAPRPPSEDVVTVPSLPTTATERTHSSASVVQSVQSLSVEATPAAKDLFWDEEEDLVEWSQKLPSDIH